jgi:hypothetical protein
MRNMCRAGIALAFLLLSVVPTIVHAADATTLGRWRIMRITMPINPIHVAMLRNGNVLIVAGSENDPASMQYRAALWNRARNTITVQTMPEDLFCNGMSFLPDGRVLIAGGTAEYGPYRGAGFAKLYNPATNTFALGAAMADGRWYPSNTILGDGRTIVISGLNSVGRLEETYEIFNPRTLRWSAPYTSPSLPLYPWGHLVAGGSRAGMVVYAGPQQTSLLLNPATRAWSYGPNTNYKAERTFGTSVMLPLTPQDGYASKILIAGGHTPGATKTAERINLSDAEPTWVNVSPMAKARVELNSTLLPNGQVLVTGGSAIDDDPSTAVRAAEMFDPATNTWSTKASAAVARLYHSVALLLPTGEVWTAGSNPTQGVWEKRMEIYTPPYLLTKNESGSIVNAPRPAITSYPTRVGYNAQFAIGIRSSAGVRSVALMRPGAVTHARDMEQRLIQLTFTASAESVTLTAPPNGNVAPPGYYLLFVNDTKGVPSVGRFLRIG